MRNSVTFSPEVIPFLETLPFKETDNSITDTYGYIHYAHLQCCK